MLGQREGKLGRHTFYNGQHANGGQSHPGTTAAMVSRSIFGAVGRFVRIVVDLQRKTSRRYLVVAERMRDPDQQKCEGAHNCQHSTRGRPPILNSAESQGV